MNDIETLNTEVVLIQTSIKRLKRAATITVTVLVAAVFAMAFYIVARPGPGRGSVSARRFNIVDKSGHDLGAWGVAANGKPYFTLRDKGGSTRLKMGLSGANEPFVDIDGEGGESGSVWSIDRANRASLQFVGIVDNEKQASSIILGFTPRSLAKTLATAQVADGSPILWIGAPKSSQGGVLEDGGSGGPRVVLFGASGNARAILGNVRMSYPNTGSTVYSGPASLVFLTHKGGVLWRAPGY
ncbi:MAG: hypothetical protein ACYDHD_04715 [Vulcanimicrobiaceae bacterium]